MAGAGQFGTAEQGIFSFWIHSHARKKPLKYIAFGGKGLQVRDAFHPDDLADLIYRQMSSSDNTGTHQFNVGGGIENAMSLAQLTTWCNERFGNHKVSADLTPRPYDIPWMVMDNQAVSKKFGWIPTKGLLSILEEIADHADKNKDWFEKIGIA